MRQRVGADRAETEINAIREAVPRRGHRNTLTTIGEAEGSGGVGDRRTRVERLGGVQLAAATGIPHLDVNRRVFNVLDGDGAGHVNAADIGAVINEWEEQRVLPGVAWRRHGGTRKDTSEKACYQSQR